MQQVISTEKIPIKLWLDDIEPGALAQAKNLANLPFAFGHVAIMPDAHQGYGMPIGGVLATRGAVIPNAVGVDIGCGVCAVKTDIQWQSLDRGIWIEILQAVRGDIPVGFKKHKQPQEEKHMPTVDCKGRQITEREYPNALKSIGTLGGGNHFIEFQKDSKENVWFMIHSGSRNLGKKVADFYNAKAIEINEKYYSQVPSDWQLAFLPLDSEEGRQYLSEMEYCVLYAQCNRHLMAERIMSILNSFSSYWAVAADGNTVNDIAHNYARMENHFGKNVMIHRKGATSARAGELGIIPGSQGTKSYIVEGKGNRDSFNSCSHGAGRLMSRTKAKKELDLAEEQEKLNSQGITHAIRSKKDLDEAAGAYKNIEEVMANQTDLVRVAHKLRPIAVIKG